jgi:hypothetical protein
MKKTLCILVFVILALTSVVAAQRHTDVRRLDGTFSGVELATHGELTIRYGERAELAIDADEDVLPEIISQVRGDTLDIRREEEHRSLFDLIFGGNRRHHISFTLTVPKGWLRHLTTSSHGSIHAPELSGDNVTVLLSSHGDITIDALRAKTVTLELSSHGDLKIGRLDADTLRGQLSSHGHVAIAGGQVKMQRVNLSSHGDYLAEGLACTAADFDLSSHGEARINVSTRLQATVSSHGRVYYVGSPALDVPGSMQNRVRPLR